MKTFLLIMFLLQGEETPRVSSYPMPDLKTCEAQVHFVNQAKLPKELEHKQVNGMIVGCMRVLPAGRDT